MSLRKIIGATLMLAGIVFAQTPDGGFTGTVYDSTSGRPIPGATVVLNLNLGGTLPLDTVLTDSAGQFVFDSVYTGSYQYVLTASETNHLTRSSAVVSLVSGQTDTVDIDLPSSAVPPQTGTFAGTVRDSVTSAPLVNALVQLRRNSTTLDSARTDDSGRYVIDNITLSTMQRYSLRAIAADYATKTVTNLVMSAAVLLDTVDFALAPQPYGSFTGTVVDSAGDSALAGAFIILRSNNSMAPLDTVVTDASGRYVIEKIPLSNTVTYSLQAVLADYTPKTVNNLDLTIAAPLDTVDFALAIQPVGTFLGTVTDSVTTAPLEGALVIIRQNYTIIDSARTDRIGGYVFDKVPLSNTLRYTITAAMDGYIARSAGNLLLSPAAPLDTVNLALPVMDTSNSWVVTGMVTTSDSSRPTPLAGTLVELYQAFTPSVRYSATADSTGRYSILVPNITRTYVMVASLDGYFPDTLNRQINADSIVQNFALVQDNTPVVRTVAASAFTGLNVYPNPANPAMVFQVGLASSGKVQITIHDISGRLLAKVAESSLPAGTHELKWNAEGLSAGMYFVRATLGDKTFTRRVLMVR